MDLAGADDDVTGAYLSSDSTTPMFASTTTGRAGPILGSMAMPARPPRRGDHLRDGGVPAGGAGRGMAQLAARGAPRLPRAADADGHSVVGAGERGAPRALHILV